MSKVHFLPFTLDDDRAALALEELCIQGKSLSLRFQRPSFRIRSQLYECSKIFCAKHGKNLIGIIAGALKPVKLRGQNIEVLYVYDLRVHPDFRRQGVGKKLCDVLIKELGKNASCLYTLIHGQNNRTYSLAYRYFEPDVAVPMTYAVLPVYKKFRVEDYSCSTSSLQVHEQYLRSNPDKEFLPGFNPEKLTGYVGSFIQKKRNAGCSIWTNENILAEQVMRIPTYMEILRILSGPLRFFWKLPSIPKSGQILRSWFLFDLFAENPQSLRALLHAAANSALDQEKNFLYLLLQNSDPLLKWIRQSKLKNFTFPYLLLARGSICPSPEENIYIDIRDL
jgi:predicted N-acetyltransferase YhbS